MSPGVRPSAIVFVVGTGTGVGKTTFTTRWVRALRARGVLALGWKPIETGGRDVPLTQRSKNVVRSAPVTSSRTERKSSGLQPT